ncbi:MAG: YraN family protein [Bryobacteraceae bacterium]|nr:YraN family protein [Bryobacteraceae bacterium]
MPSWLIGLLERLDLVRHRVRLQTLSPSRALGARAEDIAHRYLQRLGYQVVARNWRPAAGHGEIDIVAFENGTLVCVEVKARTTDEISAPERAVGKLKQAALEAASVYLAHQYKVPPSEIRFDLVAIVMTEPPRIRLDRQSSLLKPRHAVC